MGADVNAAGLIPRDINAAICIERSLGAACAALERANTDATCPRKMLGAPFEHDQELQDKDTELKQLEAELMAEGEASPPQPVATIDEDGDQAAAAKLGIGADATGFPSLFDGAELDAQTVSHAPGTEADQALAERLAAAISRR